MERWAQNLYLKQMRHVIDQYALIEPGDRILVGLSGGKDSSLLAMALHTLSRHGIYDFEVAAFTVDNGMMGPLEGMLEYFSGVGLNCIVHEEPFESRLLASDADGFSACYTCARQRKGILKREALARGYQKIAFGHTQDDFMETLMMNIMKHGRFSGLPPKLVDQSSGLTMIRPMLFLDEVNVIKAGQAHAFSIVASNCPFGAQKLRAKADETMRDLERIIPGFSKQCMKALQNRDDERLL